MHLGMHVGPVRSADFIRRRRSRCGIAGAVNFDGKLSGSELTNLRAWVDANENGIAEAGEIKTLANAGITEIRQINYIYYVAGNSVMAPATVTAPTQQSDAVAIGHVNYVQGVPDSNYRYLRDNDNLFPVSGGYLTWTVSQVNINYSSQN